MHVPDGWKKDRLGKYVEIHSGSAPSSLNLTDKGKYPYVKVEDMNNCLKYQLLSREYVNDALKPIPKYSVLFPKRGAAILNNKVRIAATEFFIDSNMMALEVLGDRLNSEFLYYTLTNEKLYKIADTSTIPQINNKHINPYLLLFPPFPEQQKIAQILSTWDKAIEKLEALIAAKQKRKKALMQQLLTGKLRFAGFEGEWKTYHLGEIFSERNESGFNDLNLLSITREKGVIPRDEVERKDTSNDDKSKYLRICPGDIGYNTMRMWQGVSALSDLEGIVSPAYTICVPKNNIDAKYASFLFKTPVVMNLFLRYSQGLTSDTWNLKFRHFSEIKITIPEKAEQQKITFVLSAADTEIQTHQKQLSALKEQKKGLMQQLLTGKKRVKVDGHV
jgi:type I restriction enzyme S subunit